MLLPKILLSRLQNILGTSFDAVLQAYGEERIGSFRINLLKSDGKDVFEEFQKLGIETRTFDGIPSVFLFDRQFEFAIKGTRAFYDGKIYLQSIASMLPVLALAPESGDRILDVCAAPGSKTTQLAMMIKNAGGIIAIEQNQIRYDKLMYNAKLQGATCIQRVKMDATKYLENSDEEFDKILLDAPCSAEGRIALKNEKSYGFWSIENIRKKSDIQYELLSLAWKRLKKGGTLVYSTCTLAPEENEGVVTRLLGENKDCKIQDIILGLSGNTWWKSGLTEFEGVIYGDDIKKAVRILPSSETEGFFMVKIIKP